MNRNLLLNSCLVAGSTFVGFVFLFFVYSFLRRPPLASFDDHHLRLAHSNRFRVGEINELRSEFANAFEFSGISFEEKPFNGKYVNKLSDRSRYTVGNDGCDDLPRDNTVWVFGGSTVYGYGLPDHQTIPSQMARLLKQRTGDSWCVKNFGRGYYYSSQELGLLLELLRDLERVRPGHVVFIDGLNDFYHLSHSTFTPKSDIYGQPWFVSQPIKFLEIGLKFVGRFQRLIASGEARSRPHVFGSYRIFGLQSTFPVECFALIDGRHDIGSQAWKNCRPFLGKAATRLLDNWRFAALISNSVGASFLPVLQPVPAYPDSSKMNVFAAKSGLGQHLLSGYGYLISADQRSPGAVNNFFAEQNLDGLNLSNLFGGDSEEACAYSYVDPVHYSNCGSSLIASRLVDLIAR